MASKTTEAFAVWITGLPASGKSTLARALASQLAANGIDAAILESDALRKVFTPHPTYTEEERNTFYNQMIWVGSLLVQHGLPVIFDATANRRLWREDARKEIPHFIEVFVDSPLAVCMARDPKGIYWRALKGDASSVPGMHAPYEPPEKPDVVVDGDREAAESAAQRIVANLTDKGFVRRPQNS